MPANLTSAHVFRCVLTPPSCALVPCSDCNLTVREIIARITAHQEQYATKFVKKKAAEDQYYDQRYATAGQPAGKAKP